MTAPLDGLRIVVTRSQEQASGLTDRLRDAGAQPVEIATIRIADPSDGGVALRRAVDTIGDFEWLVLASPNGARSLLDQLGSDTVLPRIACVGPSTARVIEEAGHQVAVVPDRFVAEGLVEAMPAPRRPDDRVLLVQAEVARPMLAQGLRAAGYEIAQVAGYRTVDAPISDADRAAAAGADMATFTSSSTVERFARLVGLENLPPVVACIGPITAATARELGLTVDIEADVSTIEGLVEAIIAWSGTRTS